MSQHKVQTDSNVDKTVPQNIMIMCKQCNWESVWKENKKADCNMIWTHSSGLIAEVGRTVMAERSIIKAAKFVSRLGCVSLHAHAIN